MAKQTWGSQGSKKTFAINWEPNAANILLMLSRQWGNTGSMLQILGSRSSSSTSRAKTSVHSPRIWQTLLGGCGVALGVKGSAFMVYRGFKVWGFGCLGFRV